MAAPSEQDSSSREKDNNFFQNLLDKKNTAMEPSLENLCLNMVYPLSMAESSVEDAKSTVKEESSRLFFSRKIDCDVQMIGGSSSDGLALPDITHMDTTKKFTEGPDEDILYLIPYLSVGPHHRRAFARLLPIKDRPGYVHLHFNSSWLEKRPLNYYKRYEHYEADFCNPEEYTDDKGYVLRRKLIGKLKSSMRDIIHSKEKEISLVKTEEGRNSAVQFSHHGPALTAEVFEHTYNVMRSKDYVIALPHPTWPDQAQTWLTRKRLWPPKKVIKTVMENGCHIVPKAHKHSNDPCEFNVSFGLASRAVAHSLNLPQFRCYGLFKYLFRFHINKAKRGLSTFHCKQTMFWTCEKSGQEKWREDNPLECLQLLLRQMEIFLADYNLPDYFIDTNNTIDHISKSSADAIRKDVEKVQDTCWYTILELTDIKRFSWLSKDISLVSLFSLCMSSFSLTKEVMVSTVLQYAVQLLDKGELFLVLQLIGIDFSVVDWLDRTIKQLHDILKLQVDGDTSSCLKGFQATLHCQKAMQMLQIHNVREYKVLLDKSRDVFLDVLSNVGTHTWIYGEYYNFLSLVGEYQQIVEHFASHLNPCVRSQTSPLYQGGVYTCVNAHNRLTTDYCVRESMQDCQIPATAYLFYKTIQSLLSLHFLNNDDDRLYFDMATKTLTHFDKWARYKFAFYPESTDEHVHVLLAYCYDGVGNHKLSERYFKIAESCGMDYKEETDDLVFTEPVLTLLRQTAKEQRTLRSKPYHRPSESRKRNHCKSISRGITIKFCEVRINPFVHY